MNFFSHHYSADWNKSVFANLLFFKVITLSFIHILSSNNINAKEPSELIVESESDFTDETNDEVEIIKGHSFHGEAFNEGPRQKAYLMDGMGDVTFPISSDNVLAQKFFNQGICQLHGFWYFEAERSFRQVAMLDPECAMAYWGMAMANFENDERAIDFIEEASNRTDQITDRELLWIKGLDTYLNSKEKNAKDAKHKYIKDIEEIIHNFPEDIEAKAFLCVRLYQFKGDLPIVSHQAVDAILQQIFATNPMHPAHHYRIHLWDREKPERALRSAALGGQSGPGIAHLWHMPGHIHSRLKRYSDAVWQQEASSRADHAHMIRDRVMPDQIHNYAHNQEWMIRNMIKIGRSKDALGMSKNLVANPRHPKYNTLEKQGTSASYGRMRLLQVLERFEMWEDLIQLSKTMYFERTELPLEQEKRLRALGIAYSETNNPKLLLANLVALQGRLAKVQTEKNEAIAKAEKNAKELKKAKEEIHKSRSDLERKFKDRIKFLTESISELSACAGLLAGATDTTIALLDNVKIVYKDRLARLYLRAGDLEKAESLAQEAVKSADNEVLPLANLIDVLFRVGKKNEASKAFDELRKISGQIDDLTNPPFQRLSKIAEAFDLPVDWRVPTTPAKDVGERPELATIGPLRYTPPVAPNWNLPMANGQNKAMKQFKGDAVIVVFYLGHGCLHCVEQLTAFAPRVKDFAKAGISLVGISTDETSSLKNSLNRFQAKLELKDGLEELMTSTNARHGFPFPLVSDANLKVFKAYKAFDDFENQPLHGTFLIDGKGLVRWQDISYEPFKNLDFLLEESKRLLGMPVIKSYRTATVQKSNDAVTGITAY